MHTFVEIKNPLFQQRAIKIKRNIMSNWLNFFGLFIDIIGVVGLYFTKIKNLNNIRVPFYTRAPISSNAESGLHATVARLIYEINKNIEDVGRINKRNDRRAVK